MIQIKQIHNIDGGDGLEQQVNEYLKKLSDEKKQVVEVRYVQAGEDGKFWVHGRYVIVYETNEAVTYEKDEDDS